MALLPDLPKRTYFIGWSRPDGSTQVPIEWINPEYEVTEYAVVLLQEGNNNIIISWR